MKFTFAAACLLGVTLAKRKFALADDSGLNHENVATADRRDDEYAFKSEWGVEEYKHNRVRRDIEDGEGWEIHNTLIKGRSELSISKNDLYDETIFEGSNGVVFNVGFVGTWFYENPYIVILTITCSDGNMIEQKDNGTVFAELKNIKLEADTTSCDITNVKVVLYAGLNVASRWKDMELYAWNDSEVIEDHFWTNEDGYKVEPEHCFDMVSVTSEQTAEFIANSSTPAFIDKADQLVAGIELYRVTKDGEWIEQVAESISAEAVGEANENFQSTLVYKSKVEEDTFYQLCFFWDEPDLEGDEYEAKAGQYQYGYHILGEDEKFEHHTDTNE